MKCPHCLTEFHDQVERFQLGRDADGEWVLNKRQCPKCRRFVFHLEWQYPRVVLDGVPAPPEIEREIMVYPKGSSRPPCPPDVPKQYADDYTEACIVLPDSAKASAALARRTLQNVLRGEAKVKPGNLADEIQQVLDSGKLPSQVAESIDAIRNVGNFAAHPMKSQQTGEVLDVETGEAEWNLDVLEMLFDFYFVQPAIIAKKRAALDQKLQAAGKPPMK